MNNVGPALGVIGFGLTGATILGLIMGWCARDLSLRNLWKQAKEEYEAHEWDQTSKRDQRIKTLEARIKTLETELSDAKSYATRLSQSRTFAAVEMRSEPQDLVRGQPGS